MLVVEVVVTDFGKFQLAKESTFSGVAVELLSCRVLTYVFVVRGLVRVLQLCLLSGKQIESGPSIVSMGAPRPGGRLQ